MDFSIPFFFVLGLALLVAGAKALVRGAANLAAALGISSLVIGLTVVALGTSAPETAVSIQAVLSGQEGADLAVGNVVGSNIFNVLFILGLSAALTPLVVSKQLVRVDVPLMIGVSVLAYVLALDGLFSRLDGALLFAGIVAYTLFTWRQGKSEANARASASEPRPRLTARRLLLDLLLMAGGLAMLVVGSRWLVHSASAAARALGVSELVIGLTIVTAGTSLPEVATSVMAAIKGECEIAVGNVVGSNLFNILCVLGLSSLVAPSGVNVSAPVLRFDLPVMIAVAVACLPIFFTGSRVARWEGFLFLGYYAAYTTILILAAVRHEVLDSFAMALFGFVLPLTVITLGVTSIRELRARRQAQAT